MQFKETITATNDVDNMSKNNIFSFENIIRDIDGGYIPESDPRSVTKVRKTIKFS